MSQFRTDLTTTRREWLVGVGCLGPALLLNRSTLASGRPTSSVGGSTALSGESAEMQRRIDDLHRSGGGTLRLAAGETTVMRHGPIVHEGVTLDLNGGTLLLVLTAHDATGVRLRSNAAVRNGRVAVRSLGQPSRQAGVHAPVVVGPLYGEGGTPNKLSPDEGVSSWSVRDLILESDKWTFADGSPPIGAAGVQIMGGVHDGLIENVTIPDSARMCGGIHLDWGFVGSISSQTISASAAHFRAGRAWTTHPNRITIRNIRIGRLSGSPERTFGIRLSGVHDISVENVNVQAVTGTVFCHTAGDLGFEFALPAASRRACRGIRVADGRVAEGSTSYLIWTDSFADNIAREAAVGYRPIRSPIHMTDILFERISGSAYDRRSSNYGVRVNHQRGGRIVDCVARGYRRGFYVDEQVHGLELVRPVAIDSEEAGISVEHPSRIPSEVTIVDPVIEGAGPLREGCATSDILVGRSRGVVVRGIPAGRVCVTPDAAAAQVVG